MYFNCITYMYTMDFCLKYTYLILSYLYFIWHKLSHLFFVSNSLGISHHIFLFFILNGIGYHNILYFHIAWITIIYICILMSCNIGNHICICTSIFRWYGPPFLYLYLYFQMVWATISVFLPAAFPCKPLVCPGGENSTDTTPVSHM